MGETKRAAARPNDVINFLNMKRRCCCCSTASGRTYLPMSVATAAPKALPPVRALSLQL